MPGWQTVDGDKLKRLRQERMLSQMDLQRSTGVAQHTISNLETGTRKAQPRTVRKLAAALEVEPRELVSDE